MERLKKQSVTISNPDATVKGAIHLYGSKSISNRVLIIRHLCDEYFRIQNLSKSDDTETLHKLLEHIDASQYYCGHAGTTYRFMTALLAFHTDKEVTVNGSERMEQRPIGALVDALRRLGANIEYLKNEGYPPLRIRTATFTSGNEVTIDGSISSQFITALLLVAPSIPNGLILHIKDKLVSRPYVEMTLSLMKIFGVNHVWEKNTITVHAQAYKAQDIYIEGDWSSASYMYSLAALSGKANIEISGLHKESIQPDSKIAIIAEKLGVKSTYHNNLIQITKSTDKIVDNLEVDFIDHPDIAQTVAVMCAGLGVTGLFCGLETLRIKETDRIAALKAELAKVGCHLAQLPKKFSKKSQKDYYILDGKAQVNQSTPAFATYVDHRMALAFSTLGAVFPVTILDCHVVSKSYPDFYDHLMGLGLLVKYHEE